MPTGRSSRSSPCRPHYLSPSPTIATCLPHERSSQTPNVLSACSLRRRRQIRADVNSSRINSYSLPDFCLICQGNELCPFPEIYRPVAFPIIAPETWSQLLPIWLRYLKAETTVGGASPGRTPSPSSPDLAPQHISPFSINSIFFVVRA